MGLTTPPTPLPGPHKGQVKWPDSWPRTPPLSSRNDLLGPPQSTKAVAGKLSSSPGLWQMPQQRQAQLSLATGTVLDWPSPQVNKQPLLELLYAGQLSRADGGPFSRTGQLSTLIP